MSDEVPWQRECDCPKNHLSCLSPKEWLKRQLGVWRVNYCKEDVRDKTVHPATFPISLASMVITTFSHKGELVLDPFSGSGTTAFACANNERSCVGIELNPEFFELSMERMPPPSIHSDSKVMILNGDARNAASMVRPGTVKVCFTSPPYSITLNRKKKALSSQVGHGRKKHGSGNDWRYSQHKDDMGNLPPEEFRLAMTDVLKAVRTTMRDDGHLVINIGDMYLDGVFHPLHVGVIHAASESGFVMRNTIIWDKLPLIHGTGIFGWPSNFVTIGASFEYLLHFIPGQTQPKPPDTLEEAPGESKARPVPERRET